MLINILETAFNLIISLNKDLFEIISLSLKVTISALIIAVSISIPIGAFLALYKNKFQSFLVLISNTLMGMPPVVLGLLIYTLVSKKGIFGFLDILYTPSAMILAQTLLIIPIVISLTYEEIYKKNKEYNLLLISLNLSNFSKLKTLIYECRYALLTVALTGFGRASAEVGAVMIVGGNINHFTRVMTTAIAFETSKGSIELAVALGLILLLISLIITIIIKSLRKISWMNILPLKIHNLSYSVNGSNILNNINILSDEKKITIIAGNNGSGKSTLLKILHGLIEIPDNIIKWGDYSIKNVKDNQDPIDMIKEMLIQGGHSTQDDLKLIDKDIKKIVQESADFAIASPEPDLNELYTDILV